MTNGLVLLSPDSLKKKKKGKFWYAFLDIKKKNFQISSVRQSSTRGNRAFVSSDMYFFHTTISSVQDQIQMRDKRNTIFLPVIFLTWGSAWQWRSFYSFLFAYYWMWNYLWEFSHEIYSRVIVYHPDFHWIHVDWEIFHQHSLGQPLRHRDYLIEEFCQDYAFGRMKDRKEVIENYLI